MRLDLKVFRVQQPTVGPFQRRLQEIGGIAPLVFGQYGGLSASFEALIDTLAVKGCDQAAGRYLLDVGPGGWRRSPHTAPPRRSGGSAGAMGSSNGRPRTCGGR